MLSLLYRRHICYVVAIFTQFYVQPVTSSYYHTSIQTLAAGRVTELHRQF